MELKSFTLILFFIASSFFSFGQTAIKEPEYKGNMVLVDGATGRPLEKQKMSGKAQTRFSKSQTLAIIQGLTSPVRINAGISLQILVRAQDNSVDPVQIINFFKLTADPDKKERFLLLTRQVAFAAKEAMKIEMIPFTSDKFGTSSYLLTVGKLPPGEYALTLEGSREVFNMFGVD